MTGRVIADINGDDRGVARWAVRLDFPDRRPKKLDALWADLGRQTGPAPNDTMADFGLNLPSWRSILTGVPVIASANARRRWLYAVPPCRVLPEEVVRQCREVLGGSSPAASTGRS